MFIIGKLVWAVLQPGNLLLLILLFGVLLGFSRRRISGGQFFVRLAALGFLILAVLPLGSAMELILEERFPPPARLPHHIAGILVLGGSVSPRLSKSYGTTVFSQSPARLLAGIELARRYPEAKLAILGGEGSVFPVGYPESKASLPFLLQEGVARARIILEERSRSTHENAVFGKELIKPKSGQNWILVTSAYHMPRAVAAFRGVGWPVIPYPVDFKIDPATGLHLDFSLLDGLSTATTAGKEWVGLVAYRAFGWTDSLFPGPRPPLAISPTAAAAAMPRSRP